MGRVSGRVLRARALSVPFLLAVALRRWSAQLAWAEAPLVAGGRSVLRRSVDPLGPRRISRHLLLLPGCVLQGVLGRPAVMHGRRAAKAIPWRAIVSADPPERSPLFPVPRAVLHRHPALRRVEGVLVRRGHDGRNRVRNRCRYARPRRQRRPARRLHVRLPLAAAPDRRRRGSIVGVAGPRRGLPVRELPQRAAHDLGVDESVLGRVCRRVRAPVRHGRVARSQNPVS